MLVSLMSKSGASRAYGKWAAGSIHSKRGALFSTAALGALIFVDDYFNCLTVGTVMSPVTDRFHISRAKLAYIIDATAAPVCIIAPISSWAAAVGSSLPEGSNIDGFGLFLRTIPFNLYALLTIGMIIFMIAMQFDFGAMRKYQEKPPVKEESAEDILKKGKVYDLVIPIVTLILFCVAAMLYTGGITEGESIVSAFANCNSSLSLVFGSFFTIIVIALLYLPRRIMRFSEFANSLVDGFKAMVPAILILTFAWTLSGVCGEGYLNAGGYVSRIVNGSQMAQGILPAAFFLIAMGLSFATGTSWGTFGILIPIAAAIFGGQDSQLLVITVAAVLAGAVCGDHISDFRYNNFGVDRRRMQPYRACSHTIAIRYAGSSLQFCGLSAGRIHSKRMAGVRNRCAADVWNAACFISKIKKDFGAGVKKLNKTPGFF